MKRPANQIRPRSCRKQKPSELWIPRRVYEMAKAYAAENGMTVEAVIKDAIAEWLERYRRTAPPDGAP